MPHGRGVTSGKGQCHTNIVATAAAYRTIGARIDAAQSAPCHDEFPEAPRYAIGILQAFKLDLNLQVACLGKSSGGIPRGTLDVSGLQGACSLVRNAYGQLRRPKRSVSHRSRLRSLSQSSTRPPSSATTVSMWASASGWAIGRNHQRALLGWSTSSASSRQGFHLWPNEQQATTSRPARMPTAPAWRVGDRRREASAAKMAADMFKNRRGKVAHVASSSLLAHTYARTTAWPRACARLAPHPPVAVRCQRRAGRSVELLTKRTASSERAPR